MKKDLKKIHEEALESFDEVQSAQHDERLQSLKDRRFYSIAGAQWEGALGDQFKNKLKFEVNKIHLSVIRIINEYLNNNISVKFVSDNGADDDALMDAINGIYRANEQDSSAEEAYDNGFEESVGGGIGAWRVVAQYEDDEDPENECQKVCFEPIYDADSTVFFDAQSKKQDKSDAKKCWVLTPMTPSAYAAEYNDDPKTWPKSVSQCEFDWATPDAVYVAEYYVAEKEKEKLYVWETLDGEEERYTEEELEKNIKKLEAIGAKQVRTRTLNKTRVHKYILSGGKVIEDCGYIAGKNIPIVVNYGKRWIVDGVERFMGHVRLSTDAQRLKNMQLSKLGELSAKPSDEKPIMLAEQIAGHQSMWSRDNIDDYPYLLVNPITDQNGNQMPAGPIGYTKPPAIPPAMAALLQITEDDIQDLLGNQQNGEIMQGNISTDTANLIQTRLDMQTFIYMSNMKKARKRSAEIWLSMAKEILIEKGRKCKAVGKDGKISKVEILRPAAMSDGSATYENDISSAPISIVVEIGPSSATKRAATVRSLSNMAAMTDDPETKQVLGAMAMMNMDGEGVSDVRAYFRRKLIAMKVIKPSDQEAKEIAEEQAGQQPSPQDEYLKAAAGAEQARGVEAQADTILKQAKADETRAKTAETLVDIDIAEGEQALKVIKELGPRVTPPDIPGSNVDE